MDQSAREGSENIRLLRLGTKLCSLQITESSGLRLFFGQDIEEEVKLAATVGITLVTSLLLLISLEACQIFLLILTSTAGSAVIVIAACSSRLASSSADSSISQ